MNNNHNPLPPDYNTTEYAHIEILESGDVDIWLRRRGQLLIEKARDTARECEAGKLASIAVVGVSAVLSANPLMWIPLSVGAGGYLWTLFTEYQDTGAIKPIPLYRGRLGNLLGILEGQRGEEAHPLLEQIAYLPEQDKDEVLLLRYRFGQIAGVLGAVPQRTRFDLYRHIVEQYHARQILIERDEINAYLAFAVSEARRAMPAQDKPALPKKPVVPALQEPAVSARPTTNSQQPIANTNWIDHFISQTALIWGNQGSGKSWMARVLAKRKKDKGYRVVVLDPDSNRSEWEGVESYHDFDEITDFLRWYVDELMSRYKLFNASSMTEDAWRAKLWADGKALAIICEEVTTYADLIEDKELLTQFFRLGLTKSRKQEMPLTFVSHNNNQTALGGIRGLANLIDKMLQLELQTDIDPDTLQPTASGKGAVKLDGSNQWMPVNLPKLTQKITNFGESQPTVVQQPLTAVQSVVEDAMVSPEATRELKVSDSLAEPLKTIWLLAKEQNDWVSVRTIQQKSFAVLKGKGSEQIHQYLGLLADSGYGEIDEQGKSHSSVVFRAY